MRGVFVPKPSRQVCGLCPCAPDVQRIVHQRPLASVAGDGRSYSALMQPLAMSTRRSLAARTLPLRDGYGRTSTDPAPLPCFASCGLRSRALSKVRRDVRKVRRDVRSGRFGGG